MQMLKPCQFVGLALVLSVAAGCSSSNSGESSGQVSDNPDLYDPNAAMNASSSTGTYGAVDTELNTPTAPHANGIGVDNNGGFGMTEMEGSGGEDSALRSITTFYFEYDSTTLNSEAMWALDVHARDLQASGQRVVLEGHTDERGTREYNMALGERRARAVAEYLIFQGVSPSQLELVSYGEEQPAVMGGGESSWAKNRRVELLK